MRLLSILILLSSIIAGCTDSDTTTTASNGGASAGDFIGTMRLTDHRGRTMADQSGVTIQIEGTSFSGVSDVHGDWVIHNVPTGNYAITFSKPNFYTRRNPSYTFVGGSAPARYRDPAVNTGSGPVSPVPLGRIPQFTVTLDAITMPTKTETVDALNNKLVTYTLGTVFAHTSVDTPDSVDLGMYFIISKNPELRIEDASTYLVMATAITKNDVSTDTTVNLGYALQYYSLEYFGIQAGDVVYFKAYPVIGYPNQFNSITNKFEYIGYGAPSNVLSATF